MFSLEGKIAIVTGGGSGIGLATARRFASAGAKVVIANRSDASALAEGFGAAYLAVDVAEESQVEALVAEVIRRHGRIDILVNSAGLIDDMLPIAEMSAQAMRRHFDVNSMGVWSTMRHAAPHMAGGSIINVSSVAALLGVATYAAYSASKAAVVSLTQTAAVELADKGIRVNCVVPAPSTRRCCASRRTPISRSASSRRQRPRAGSVSRRRWPPSSIFLPQMTAATSPAKPS